MYIKRELSLVREDIDKSKQLPRGYFGKRTYVLLSTVVMVPFVQLKTKMLSLR